MAAPDTQTTSLAGVLTSSTSSSASRDRLTFGISVGQPESKAMDRLPQYFSSPSLPTSLCPSMTIPHFRDCSILTSNTPHHARIYELIVRQEPKQARMCGVGGKADRRPIDPPPIVQLRVIDPLTSSSSSSSSSTGHNMSSSSNSPPSSPPPTTHSHYPNHEPGPPADAAAYAQSYLQNPYYFMFASLAKPDDDTELHWLKDGRTRCTTGSVVSSLYHLKDPQHNNEDAGFFVFPDLSVRTEGSYRLKLSLFEVVGNNVRHCKSIYSAPFYVYTAKKFPGMEESTPLSCSLADQGIKIRIRKDIRVRKRPNPVMEQPIPLPLTSPHQQYPSNALPSSSAFPQSGSSSQQYDERDDGGDIPGKNKRHRTEEYGASSSGSGVVSMNVNMSASSTSMNVNMGGLGIGMNMDGSSGSHTGAPMHQQAQYQQPNYPQSHQQGTWPPPPPPGATPQTIPPPPGALGVPSSSTNNGPGPNANSGGSSVIPPPQGNTPGRFAMGVTIPAGMDLGGPSVDDGRGGGCHPQPFEHPPPAPGPVTAAGPPPQSQAPSATGPPPPYPTSPSAGQQQQHQHVPAPPPSQQQPYSTMQQPPPQQPHQMIPPPPPPQTHPHSHQQPQQYIHTGAATTPGGYVHPHPPATGPPHYGATAPPYTGSSSNGGAAGQMPVDQQWNPGGPTGHAPQPQVYEGYYPQQPQQPHPQSQQQYGPGPVPQQRYDYASYPPQPPQQQQQPGYGGYYDQQQQQHYGGGYAYQAPQPQPQPQQYHPTYTPQGQPQLTPPSGQQQPQYDYGHQHQQQVLPPPPGPPHHAHGPPPPQQQPPYQPPHPQPPPNPYQHPQPTHVPPVMQHQQQVYAQPPAPHTAPPSTATTGPPSTIPPPPGATFLAGAASGSSSSTSATSNAPAASPTARQPSNTAIYHQTQQTPGPPPSYAYGPYTSTSPAQQSHAAAPSGPSQNGPPSTGYGASSASSSPDWNGYAQHHQSQQWTNEGYPHPSRNPSQIGPDRIQLAPLRHHSSTLSAATSSAGASPIMPSSHNGSTSDGHAASYSVIQLRSPGRDNNKMLPPPSDFGRDRERRGSLTDQRSAGKKNPLSIGSIISNSNER
ncbi:hypothetical protein D9756_009916 [Leucocoprinus leucothites]|uniref:Velvet domain-containing protein n=1 Tax=Leucocoprinus leucothites TaxID=201217 RepID=A0A8H5FRV4_9AGAR|nr:hypothetical protein D9756_009916 [Leucoagaricus leucothites]